MASTADENILARLIRPDAGQTQEAWAAVAATRPAHEPESDAHADDDKLNSLLARIKNLTTTGPENGPAPTADAHAPAHAKEWMPLEPASFRDAGLTETEVESLILKFLLTRGEATGRDIAEQVRLPFVLIDPLLRQMKFEQLVAYRGTAPMNDYVYQLADLGRERGRRYAEHCTYCGSAPVRLGDYIVSVKAQSLDGQHPSLENLKQAFHDLLINPQMFARLGPAINSGRGMFLYGCPGNGKTSIAERVTRAFGQYIWIPRCLGFDGEIMRVFDPMNHVEAPLEKSEGLLDKSKIDRRWVRIVRPTIVVGGELTMDNLEASFNSATGICESPVQLKSNCGTLVIDDFGRQKIRTDELLNRWIVPLEKRFDFLNLPSGKKVQVPFDQLVIFSTNLQPKDLVDDAFLRRIPYKIEVPNPSEDEFRRLFKILAPKMGFEYNEPAVTYLIEDHYKAVKRPFRFCQPRDLLLQVRNYCMFQQCPLELSREKIDFAVANYFAVMD
ncbi:MAG: AAA family ATPase [Planctomycetes bacterium]|nr:AAA family ATPase [Planctomycetota bacterium]